MGASTQPGESTSVWLRPGGVGRLVIELAGLLCICALLVLGLRLAMVQTPRYPVDLTVKEPSTRLELANFHIPESNDEFSYRWSRPYAFIQLQNAGMLAPGYLASVRLRVPAPDPTRQLTFLVNERPVAAVVPTPVFRVYRLALSAGEQDPALRLGLSAPELRLPGDARPLGVVLTGAELVPVREARPALLWTAGLGLAALWGLLRRSGASARETALVCAGLGVALIGLAALAQPGPLRMEWLVGAVYCSAAGAVLLAREWHARLGLGLIGALAAFSGAIWPSWLTDDAYISFRYAQNLAAGNGLVYNIGERVEGYTNFLWTILAALVIRLGGEIGWWAYIAGVVLALAIVLATFTLARRMLGPNWALAAALLVGTSQSLLIHTARGAGLETGLFTLLATLGSILYLQAIRQVRSQEPRVTSQEPGARSQEPEARSQEPGARSQEPGARGQEPGARSQRTLMMTGIVLALATLTRPEGVLLLGLTVLHLVGSRLTRRQGDKETTTAPITAIRTTTPLLLAYVLIVVPFFVWRFGYYGDLLPNTFYAKTGGGLRAALRGLEYTWGFILTSGGPLLLFTLLPARQQKESRLQWSYLLLLCGVYTLYVIAVGGDHFPGERFYVPLIPWLATLAAGGMARAVTLLRGTALQPIVPALLALLLAGYSGYALTRSGEQDVIVAGSDENLTIWREIGWWLADNAGPNESSAAMSAGAIAFYSERTTIDMLGLADRHIARITAPEMGEGPAGHEKRDPDYVLNQRRPTFIPAMWEDYFGGAEALRGRYNLINARTRTGREVPIWRRREL